MQMVTWLKTSCLFGVWHGEHEIHLPPQLRKHVLSPQELVESSLESPPKSIPAHGAALYLRGSVALDVAYSGHLDSLTGRFAILVEHGAITGARASVEARTRCIVLSEVWRGSLNVLARAYPPASTERFMLTGEPTTALSLIKRSLRCSTFLTLMERSTMHSLSMTVSPAASSGAKAHLW